MPNECVGPQRVLESVDRSLLDRNGSREARCEFQTRNHTHSFGSILLEAGRIVLRRVRTPRGHLEGLGRRVVQLLFVLVSSRFPHLRRDAPFLPKRCGKTGWQRIGLSSQSRGLSSLTQRQEKVLRCQPTFLIAWIFQYHFAQRWQCVNFLEYES